MNLSLTYAYKYYASKNKRVNFFELSVKICRNLKINLTEAMVQRCFSKLCKIYRKTLVPATLLKRLWHRCFLVNFVKFYFILFLFSHISPF